MPVAELKTPNIAEPEVYCLRCGNSGWVELAGEVHALGTVYSRGMTACKWCEEGERRYRRAVGAPRDKHDNHRRWTPVSDFVESDIIPVGIEEGRASKPDIPLVPQLPGMEDEPVVDLELGARRTYAAWRKALGKDLADARLRQRAGPEGEPLDRKVYPLPIVELVIAEADAAELPTTPEPEPDTEETI